MLSIPVPQGCSKLLKAIHFGEDMTNPMVLFLAAVWLLLDYPWGLLAFLAIARSRAPLSQRGAFKS